MKQILNEIYRLDSVSDNHMLDSIVELYKNSPLEILEKQCLKIDTPKFEELENYRKLFWKIYTQNILQLCQYKEIILEKYIIRTEIDGLDKLLQKLSSFKIKSKKNRRYKSQINKIYCCPYEDCLKIYGTEVALNYHIKTKHYGGNKRERRGYFKQFVDSWMQGKEPMVGDQILPKKFFAIIKDELYTGNWGKDRKNVISIVNKLQHMYSNETTSLPSKPFGLSKTYIESYQGDVGQKGSTIIYGAKRRKIIGKTHSWVKKI